MIISKKLSRFNKDPPNLDIVILGCILHDMGWSTSHESISKDKRFEVDSANIARDFITNQGGNGAVNRWDKAKLQRMWDAIALHGTASIAAHAASEVALVQMGVVADFMGPKFSVMSGEQNLITLDEYHAVMKQFPRAGFNGEGFKKIICGLCHAKPETTYDNWVGSFGLRFGTDGIGGGQSEFTQAWEQRQFAHLLVPALDTLEALDKTA